jgi:hypothetical protein
LAGGSGTLSASQVNLSAYCCINSEKLFFLIAAEGSFGEGLMKVRLLQYWSRTLDLVMLALLLAAPVPVPVPVQDKATARRARRIER